MSPMRINQYHYGIHYANNFTSHICQLVCNASHYSYYYVRLFVFYFGIFNTLGKRDRMSVSLIYANTLPHFMGN